MLFSAAGVMCGCVTCMFWAIQAKDPKGILDLKNFKLDQLIVNHLRHTTPYISLVFYSLLGGMPVTTSVLEDFVAPATISLLYLGMTLLVGLVLYNPALVNDEFLGVRWPYPFVDNLTLNGWIIVTIFFAFMIFFNLLIFRLCRNRSFKGLFSRGINSAHVPMKPKTN